MTVGSATPTIFHVNKALLCRMIPYFDKMFNGPWKESQNNSVDLPEDDVEACKVLFTWVYNGKLPYDHTVWLSPVRDAN